MPRRDNRFISTWSLLVTTFAIAAVMIAFEAAKQFLIPRLSLWESHLLTILFTTVPASVAAFLVGRKFAGLSHGMAKQEHAAERERLSHQMQLVLESTGHGMYGIDLQGRCTSLNIIFGLPTIRKVNVPVADYLSVTTAMCKGSSFFGSIFPFSRFAIPVFAMK